MKYLIYHVSMLLFLSCAQSRVETDDCSSGLYRFHRPHHNVITWGYMDIFDSVIIKAKYTDARQFSEGLAAVKLEDKWGFINPKDSVVIPFKYDWVSSFGEYGFKGIAIVKINSNPLRNPTSSGGNTGFINKKGELISHMNYKNFSQPYFGAAAMTGQDDKWGVVDMHAKEIVPCIYDSVMYKHLNSDTICLYKDGVKNCYGIKSLLAK